MRVAVVIASTGRPKEVAQWSQNLARQTMAPSSVIYSIVNDGDIFKFEDLYQPSIVIKGAAGLSAQRNRALEAALLSSDIVAFFDDDYIPEDFCLERISEFMTMFPNVVGASGELIIDGINTQGIEYEDALAMLTKFRESSRTKPITKYAQNGLYGCNMIYRSSHIGSTKFDEELPLYAWQEDVDFALQMKIKGEVVRTNAFVGIHQGIKHGRTSGLKLGYSQVANPYYLIRKGTVPFWQGCRLIIKNLAANVIRAPWPEHWIDRKGRLKGNLIAIKDFFAGNLHPRQILTL